MGIVDILVMVVISAVVSTLVVIFFEAFMRRESDRELSETEFYEDDTEHDVPEMVNDFGEDREGNYPTTEGSDEDLAYLEERRQQGGPVW